MCVARVINKRKLGGTNNWLLLVPSLDPLSPFYDVSFLPAFSPNDSKAQRSPLAVYTIQNQILPLRENILFYPVRDFSLTLNLHFPRHVTRNLTQIKFAADTLTYNCRKCTLVLMASAFQLRDGPAVAPGLGGMLTFCQLRYKTKRQRLVSV